nr:MAG TPA: hypothetical protein [Caudoviricetes sp.]
MVNVSQDIIKSFNEGNQQTALIEVTSGSKTFTITEADIIQGGLKIDRYCVTNSKIEVGSAVASELSLKLRNYDGKFNDVSFEGAVLNVKIGIKLSSVLEGATLGKGILGRMILGSASSEQDVAYVPCGLFIVDTPPRKLSTISISALDYMVLFDREVNASALSFPIHVDALIQKICSICNVTLATDVSVLPNHYFSIGGLPDTNQKLTYRQLLQWCAQLTGTCAFMDGSGRLVLKWYEQTGVTITASERYSSDMLENDITITGFTCDDSKGNTYLSGTADYTLDLSDCGFLTNAYEGVLKELQTARGGFAYRPYSATIKSAPYLFPLDMIRYKDKDGVVHDTIVTNVTLALNCNTAISGAGETITSSSYAQSTSGVTSQQAATDRSNLEKINQTATQTSQNKQDLTQFRTEYSFDLEKTNAAIEARVTKETYQTDMNGVSTRIGAAETKIGQNADAITFRATKEEAASYAASAEQNAKNELYSMMTFTADNGLVITRSGWEGKVQITGQNVQVVRGNNKVVINDNGIAITDGYGSVSIYSGGISLHGIRNSKIFEWPYEKDSHGNPTGKFTAQTTKIDLSSYSSVMLVYDTHKSGTWFASGGGAGRLTVVLPVNGQTYSYAYPWNTTHWRTVKVSDTGITFGSGNERTSSYSGTTVVGVWSFNLQNPGGDGVNQNDEVCRPLELYGFM